MRFIMQTLVDITPTGARKGDNPFQANQHQNFLTAINTISMRANPYNVNVTFDEVNVTELPLDAEGNQKIWTLTFEFESEGQHSLEMLTEDMHIVPVIPDLENTVNCNAFLTQGSVINTIFAMPDDK
jgi:hypothetical protein